LQDIIERELEIEILHGEEDGEKNRKLGKDKKTAEEMRLQSLKDFQKPEREKQKIVKRMM
jgi:hypothetical protein